MSAWRKAIEAAEAERAALIIERDTLRQEAHLRLTRIEVDIISLDKLITACEARLTGAAVDWPRSDGPTEAPAAPEPIVPPAPASPSAAAVELGRRSHINQPPIAEKPVTPAMEKVWRAVVTIVDAGREATWGAVLKESGVAKGSMGFLVESLERRGLVARSRGGVLIPLKRPDDMPLPVAAPPGREPPILFTKTTTVARPPSKLLQPSTPPPAEKKTPAPPSSKEPVVATVRDVVRYLAKDIGLIVRGPDDEDSYVVERDRGLRGPGLIEIANKWRARRNEPPFKLVS